MGRGRRTGYSRGGRGKGQSRGSAAPHVIGAVLAIGLLGGAGWWMNRTASTMALDEAFCPVANGPVAQIAILFDLTDPMAPAQSAQLLQYIKAEFSKAAVGTQFTMGVVSENERDWGATAPLCKPPSE